MKRIKIDFSKCTGCHTCEAACSLQHIDNIVNPKRSRIRILKVGDVNLPLIAGPYTEAECTSKGIIFLGDQEYDQCIFCGEPPDPQCVRWCSADALTLVDN